MVLLHLAIEGGATASHRFRVDLPHKIPSQVMRLTKTIVNIRAPHTHTKDVIYVALPFISGFEVTNNNAHSYLAVSTDPDPNVSRTESQRDERIKVEEVEQSFFVELYKDPNGTPFELQTMTADKINAVHLFLEYETNNTFH